MFDVTIHIDNTGWSDDFLVRNIELPIEWNISEKEQVLSLPAKSKNNVTFSISIPCNAIPGRYNLSFSIEGKRNKSIHNISMVMKNPTDLDNDGWNNSIEIEAGTDPQNSLSYPTDLDNDTILDYLDLDIDGDGDGDGWNNSIEIQWNTDPYDVNSFPSGIENNTKPDTIDNNTNGEILTNENQTNPNFPDNNMDDDEKGVRAVWAWLIGAVVLVVFAVVVKILILCRKANKIDERDVEADDFNSDELGRVGKIE